MNKRGQGIFLGVIIGIFIFMFGITFLNFVTPEITGTRNETNFALPGLDCPNENITDGAKLTCLAVDLVAPGYIIALLSVVGGFLTVKFLSEVRRR